MTNETRCAKIRNAEAMMKVFSRVPEQNQPLFTAMMECMLAGVELSQAPPPQRAARPSA